jgi:hypothetical protein
MTEKYIANRPLTLWDKVPIKEILLALLGAVITWGVTVMADRTNNSQQLRKELREKKNIYIDNYLKDLNQRFYLFVELVDEDANIDETQSDTVKIFELKQKLEEAKTNLNVNSFYDEIQFHRYFNGAYYDTLKQINSAFNDYTQYAEANDKTYIYDLKERQDAVLKRIKNIEKKIYKDMDKD